MVAFVGSFAVGLVLIAAIVFYAQKRPVDASLTWGEAMVASVFVFFCFFWAYGVVPQTWFNFYSGELKWRPDEFLIAPSGDPDWFKAPFSFSRGALAEILMTVIYGFFLTAHVGLFMLWNRRGKLQESQRRRALLRGRSGARRLARPGQTS